MTADEAEQVVTGRVQRLAAELDHRSVDQHHPDAEQIVGGDAIFQAVGAAGIHADIAADRAGELRARIWCIEKPVRGDAFRDVQIGDAGLNHGDAVRQIDFKDAVHLRQAEHDGILLRNGAAGERSAGAAGHDGNAVTVAITHDSRNFSRGARQGDGERQAAIGNEGIGLERHQLARLMNQAFGRQKIGEIGNDPGAARQHISARGEKRNGVGHGVLSDPDDLKSRRKDDCAAGRQPLPPVNRLSTFPKVAQMLSTYVKRGKNHENRMTNLGDLEIFAKVVSTGSMSLAGRTLGFSPAVVSKRIKRLEDRLGTRLLQRTTRQISLTEAGQGFYDRVLGILAGLEEAEFYISGRSAQMHGTLKVSAPTSFGRMHIAPHLKAFMQAHPELAINLVLTDEFSDIVGGGFDLAIRIAELTDSSLVARRLRPCAGCSAPRPIISLCMASPGISTI